MNKRLILLILLSIGIRLLVLPFATTNSADTVQRVWIAWRWLSNPHVITHGVWGPFHFYLIALSMTIYEDPILAPAILHILFSVFTLVPLSFFLKSEFYDETISFFVTLCYAFYPMAICNSLVPQSESPFIFFLMISLFFLSKARREGGSRKDAVAAGLFLTLAGMLRYEGWMLIPLLSMVLWKKPSFSLYFIMAALLHPAFWMIGNWQYHGDPLYSIHWASNWELNLEGRNENLSPIKIMERILFFPAMTFLGMTPLVGFLCFVGIALSLLKEESRAIWLLPSFGLMFLLVISAVRGSLALKAEYALVPGTLLFPFLGVFYARARIPESSSLKRTLITVGIIGSMILFFEPKVIGFDFPSLSGIPRFQGQEAMKTVGSVVRNNLRESEGLICDFFGYQHSYYVALMTRFHPDDIFMAPGGKHETLTVERLILFLRNHPRGVLVLKKIRGLSEHCVLLSKGICRSIS